MTESEQDPVIRDKRRLDPTTGELRNAEEVPAAEAGTALDAAGDGAASSAADPTSGGAPGAEGVPADQDPVAAAKAEAADLQDQLARAKADLYNLDQRFNNFVKRSRAEALAERGRGVEDAVEAIIPVLDDIHHAREHDGLTGPLGAMAEKLEEILASRFKVERYGAAGDTFDPNVHEALMHNQDDEVTTETVSQVLQPGYRVGEKVVRPARVAVTGPQ